MKTSGPRPPLAGRASRKLRSRLRALNAIYSGRPFIGPIELDDGRLKVGAHARPDPWAKIRFPHCRPRCPNRVAAT